MNEASVRPPSLADRIKGWWADNQLERHPSLTWIIRSGFLILCFYFGWLIWLFAQKAFPPPSLFGEWRLLDGNELVGVVVYSIAVFGGLQAFIRWFGGPRIEIAVHGGEHPIPLWLPDYAIHHLEVWNWEWHWFWRPLVVRTAPEGCVIKCQYWKEHDGRPVTPMFGGGWLLGRWNINPEPITGEGLSQSALIVNRRLAKLFPSEPRLHCDSQPFTVAFAIKKRGDEKLYHFNDESYKFAGDVEHKWCDPQRSLGPGVYRVIVRVSGYGQSAAKVAAFRLTNLGTDHDTTTLKPLTRRGGSVRAFCMAETKGQPLTRRK